jgi:hypothetical protein
LARPEAGPKKFLTACGGKRESKFWFLFQLKISAAEGGWNFPRFLPETGGNMNNPVNPVNPVG